MSKSMAGRCQRMTSYIDIIHDKLLKLSKKRNIFFYIAIVTLLVMIVYHPSLHKEEEAYDGTWRHSRIGNSLLLVGIVIFYIITEKRIRSLEGELNEAQERMKKLKISKTMIEKIKKIPTKKERLRKISLSMIVAVAFIYIIYKSAARNDMEGVLWFFSLFNVVILGDLQVYKENSLKNKLSEAKNILKDANLEQ